MSNTYDVFVTMGHRYQVVRTEDNSPMGPSHATRKEAEAARNELYAKDYEGVADVALERETAVRTSETLDDIQKGLVSDSPGVSSHSDRKKVTS